MKKQVYIRPDAALVAMDTMPMMAASGVTSEGIEYGGVDGDGSLTPAARQAIDLLDF